MSQIIIALILITSNSKVDIIIIALILTISNSKIDMSNMSAMMI